MVFSSLTFIFFFLPITLLVYYASPRKMKNTILLLLSIVFYAWGEPVYVFLILFSTVMDYCFGLVIAHFKEKNKHIARLTLISALIFSIGILSFFKYADFLIENMNTIFHTNIAALELPLPIGISFYTFQSLSYIIDVYRKRVQAQKNPIKLMMYITLFPQLIAGPIVRYKTIEHQLTERKWNPRQFTEGIQHFTIGLGKKVLIANNIGMLWQTIQAEQGEIAILTAWLGVIAFALHIYFDFSGYSSMAIGLGKMLGFDFPENFRHPYTAQSVSEFWRRWHITLGQWFRDYIYIPLGGSRTSKWKMYRNLLIVWSLTGLWHGANWNFLLWGIYFGLFIALEKAILSALLEKIPAFLRHAYLLMIVSIGWVLFAIEDIRASFTYTQTMFGWTEYALYDDFFLYHLTGFGMILIIGILCSTPLALYLWRKIPQRIRPGIALAGMMVILFMSTAYLVDESFNPFIYFRF